jgi:hypothetical protein
MISTEINRLIEIAEKALEKWAGWLDDSRGTVDEECEAMKKEVAAIKAQCVTPSQKL